jgi:integrase
MAIFKRKSGKYSVRIDLEPGAKGGRRRKRLGTYRTRKEEEAAERKALDAKARGIDLDGEKDTLAKIVERFFKSVGPDLAPVTLARYEGHWAMHIAPSLGGVVVARLKPAHLAELYGKLRSERIVYPRRKKNGEQRTGTALGPNTVIRVHRLLHRILGWAEAVNLVTRNVARCVQPPKAAPSPARALTAEQVGAILTASEGTMLHPFFVVAAMTGMRRGEVGALAWSAIDLERRTLLVRQAIGEDRKGGSFVKTTKSGRERVVPLGTAAVEALKRQRAPQAAVRLAAKEGTYDEAADLVFADDHGKPLDLDKVSKGFAALASSLGIKAKGISLHSLRHFGATQALVAGNDVRTVAALLGHASPSTTLNVYGHVVAGAQERAVAGIDEAIAQAQGRRSAG